MPIPFGVAPFKNIKWPPVDLSDKPPTKRFPRVESAAGSQATSQRVGKLLGVQPLRGVTSVLESGEGGKPSNSTSGA